MSAGKKIQPKKIRASDQATQRSFINRKSRGILYMACQTFREGGGTWLFFSFFYPPVTAMLDTPIFGEHSKQLLQRKIDT